MEAGMLIRRGSRNADQTWKQECRSDMEAGMLIRHGDRDVNQTGRGTQWTF